MTNKRWMGDMPPGAIALHNEADNTWKFSVPLWQYWYQIARRSANEALAQRTPDVVIDASSARMYGGEERKIPPDVRIPHPGDEMFASMVAVAASAHAIDGFYGSIKQLVNPPASNAARARQIHEALKLGFNVGKPSQLWLKDLDWLFKARDGIVHHAEKYEPMALLRETEETEIYGSPDLIGLKAETADRAARIAETIISICVRNPKPATKKWAEETATIVFETEW